MEVINHPLFGNTLVARRPFSPGELFLREAPLIVCKDTNDAGATFDTQLPAVRDAFRAAAPEVQQKILAMMWCGLLSLSAVLCARAGRREGSARDRPLQ